jgi:hypothetical protein
MPHTPALRVTTAAALVALMLAACQTAAPGSPAISVSSPSVVTQAPSASSTVAAGSPSASAAPLEACSAPAQDPKVWVVVHNSDQEEYILEVVGRDGACNWPIKAQANGGVTVPAAAVNAIRVRSAADCAVIAQTEVGAGIYDITMQSGSAILRTIQETDALGLGAAPVAPCAAGG